MAQDTGTNLCTAALRKLRAIDPAETPDPTELANVFAEFKRMIKSWGAAGELVFTSTLDQHTLTGGTQSYTIGSGADINTSRPIKILKGTYVRANGLDRMLTIIGETSYLSISNKSTGVLDTPEKIWYKPEFASGRIYLWPPGGGELYLYSLKDLAEPSAIGDSVVYPDYYQDAIVWNLACRVSNEFIGDPTPYQMAMADHTLSVIRNLNMANDPPELINEMNLLDKHYGLYDIDAG